jgi:excisionase family DNA binding protein
MSTIEPLLTKEQVCEILGVKESWLNTEIQTGRFPHTRLGSMKHIRFTKAQVQDFIDSRAHNANEEKPEELHTAS